MFSTLEWHSCPKKRPKISGSTFWLSLYIFSFEGGETKRQVREQHQEKQSGENKRVEKGRIRRGDRREEWRSGRRGLEWRWVMDRNSVRRQRAMEREHESAVVSLWVESWQDIDPILQCSPVYFHYYYIALCTFISSITLSFCYVQLYGWHDVNCL